MSTFLMPLLFIWTQNELTRSKCESDLLKVVVMRLVVPTLPKTHRTRSYRRSSRTSVLGQNFPSGTISEKRIKDYFFLEKCPQTPFQLGKKEPSTFTSVFFLFCLVLPEHTI